jgi:hypothetical protein
MRLGAGRAVAGFGLLAMATAMTMVGWSETAATEQASQPERLARLQALQARLEKVESIHAIERLHHIYAWQQDYMLFNFQADLFSDDPRA